MSKPDYSKCDLPQFKSKHDGYNHYNGLSVTLELALYLRLRGFNEPTHMAWRIDLMCNAYYDKRQNHNDFNVKISLPTKEQAEVFMKHLQQQ